MLCIYNLYLLFQYAIEAAVCEVQTAYFVFMTYMDKWRQIC